MRTETLWLVAIFLAQGDAFSTRRPSARPRSRRTTTRLPHYPAAVTSHGSYHSISTFVAFTEKDDGDSQVTVVAVDRPPCVYRSPSRQGQWTPRVELADLKIGQELEDAVVVQELLDGKTGPKLFVDCGVGRYKQASSGSRKKSKNGWKMQTAMLRLPRGKKSVTNKRAARLRKKPFFSVFVNKIRLDNDQLEVCLNEEDVQPVRKLKSASKLKPGDECVGTIRRVEPYGVLVGLEGINRPGLLHINKVADLYGHYIKKVEGLNEAGLERGARIKVQVESNERKRLYLDFTDSVKAEAQAEMKQREKEQEAKQQKETTATAAATSAVASATTSSAAGGYDALDSDDDPYADYAEWAAVGPTQDQGGEDDEYDDYDEDRDIEDALGLGSY